MFKLGVSGASGKMGKRIISLAKENKDIDVIFGLEDENHPSVGKVVDGVKITADSGKIKECDCLIDFSAPAATIENLSLVRKFSKCMVIGTTGFDHSQRSKIKELSSKTGVVFSPNMSVGVNLLFRLVKESAHLLKKYNVFIEEAHHIHKKDAPSGTAKKIAEIINRQGFNLKIEDIKAVREDEIVGDHRVVFESDADRIELFHSAKTRDIFAKGAILAARWVLDKPAGLYSMDDVLFGK
ncbi:MAG: 4-hydroxy-tetrahydrodipicolinate reductase [Candidatus Omnitrophota bacterium]|nr:MAG: 4-hydroxy-tetrahydrodipicolinate reductase [Candidatus Omnitrophota bacterium]